MATYETFEVPFVIKGNRRCITRQQLEEIPGVGDFVRSFRDLLEWDSVQEVYWFYPEGASNGTSTSDCGA